MGNLVDDMKAEDWQLIWKVAKQKGMAKKVRPKKGKKNKPLADVLDDLDDGWNDMDDLAFDDEGTVKPKAKPKPKPKSGRDEKTLAILKKMGYKVK